MTLKKTFRQQLQIYFFSLFITFYKRCLPQRSTSLWGSYRLKRGGLLTRHSNHFWKRVTSSWVSGRTIQTAIGAGVTARMYSYCDLC